MSNKIYVSDLGTVIEIDMQENLTAFTVLKLKVKKPKADGSAYETADWTAAQKSGAGNENILQYVASTTTSPFDVDGVYYLQPYGETSGWKGRGETVLLIVYKIFT